MIKEADDAAEPRVQPLSRRLEEILAEVPNRITFSGLAAALHARAWGGLLFVFGAIDLLPLPPGASIFFALPLLLISAQMVMGRATPWFPHRIERRGIAKHELERLIGKIGWIELRIERIFKPRISTLTGPVAARMIGGICFCLALVAAIPIPLFHFAPAAAIVLFGLALLYRDGVLVIVAVAAAALSVALDAAILGTGVIALSYAAGFANWVLDLLGMSPDLRLPTSALSR